MAGFTPFKRHAKQFNYTPRHYDPIKEEFEKRREVLRGERRDTKSSIESGESSYTPGQYIRSKRMAREMKRRESTQGGKRRVWVSVVIVIMVFLFGSMLYPKILEAFNLTSSPAQVEDEYEEFNPYAPITVVPNDYVEESK